jgi:hypothetical protein
MKKHIMFSSQSIKAFFKKEDGLVIALIVIAIGTVVIRLETGWHPLYCFLLAIGGVLPHAACRLVDGEWL